MPMFNVREWQEGLEVTLSRRSPSLHPSHSSLVAFSQKVYLSPSVLSHCLITSGVEAL